MTEVVCFIFLQYSSRCHSIASPPAESERPPPREEGAQWLCGCGGGGIFTLSKAARRSLLSVSVRCVRYESNSFRTGYRAHWRIMCSSWPRNFGDIFERFWLLKSGFSGSLGWYQITCEGIWYTNILMWVQRGAKVDLNQRISDFSEILVLKIWKDPTLRCNITKCLDLPGLKFLVVLRGTSMNVWI